MASATSLFGGTGKPWPAYKPIPNEYIVVLADQNSHAVETPAANLAANFDGIVLGVMKNGIKAFGVRMSERQAEALARSPLVDHVEQNGEAFLSDMPMQSFAFAPSLLAADERHLSPKPLSNHCPWAGSYFLCEYGADTTFWHLDRLDNRGPLYGYRAYAFNSTGNAVRVYVLGTGVLATHEQFDGQVEAGTTFGDGFPATNPCKQFGDFYGPGHDTAVASVIAGNTNGVAKNVRIIPVKVWNCDPGSGGFANPATSILWWCYALDYILGDMASHPGVPAVVNISGGIILPNNDLCNGIQCVPAFESNVNTVISHGAVVVASANNFNNGNCNTTPERMGYGGTAGYFTPYHTITVGGSTQADQRWIRLPNEMIPGVPQDSGSNFGTCVDIYAPAQHFYHLAHIAANNSYRDPINHIDQISGTSFAAPIVSGIVARLLQRNPTWTSQQVWSYIQSQANHPGCFDVDPVTQLCRNDRLVYISPFD